MTKTNWLCLMLTSTLLGGHAYAEEVTPEDDGVILEVVEEAPEVDEVTMEVIEEGATPEDIVRLIELPDAASDVAKASAARGLETANAAREDGRAFGQGMAELRGEHGREIGAAAREAAADVASEARQTAADAAAEARQNAADAAAEARENRGRGTGRP